jgi:hypothetical protein
MHAHEWLTGCSQPVSGTSCRALAPRGSCSSTSPRMKASMPSVVRLPWLAGVKRAAQTVGRALLSVWRAIVLLTLYGRELPSGSTTTRYGYDATRKRAANTSSAVASTCPNETMAPGVLAALP